ncbi:hypothetical protein ANO11243_042070 [Dothideomycetidae sp. 11243]|nr:hypothetical protein ANO11243_042070 [fungal sp. No.11243]
MSDRIAPAVKLSCEECRRRKTKCDKGSPCSACRHAGLSCTAIQRMRLARGRHVKPKGPTNTLQSRLSQLEELVEQYGQANLLEKDEEIQASNTSATTQDPPVPTKANTLVAKDFFAALSREVAGVRETLQELTRSDANDESVIPPTSHIDRSSNTSLLFGPSNIDESVLEPPNETARMRLFEIYRDRVDCIFKATYLSAIRRAVERHYSTDQHAPVSYAASVFALERAIYFMAVCTMTENECNIMLYEEKATLTSRFRQAVELALSRAGLLTNPDKLILQTLVIYLMGLRTCKHYTESWTLLATALRVASALGLPFAEKHQLAHAGEFMMLRLHFCIAVLDAQTSLERGNAPTMGMHHFHHQPVLANESEVHGLSMPRQSKIGLCDMSFSHIIYESTMCTAKLNEIGAATPGSYQNWHKKKQLISDLESRLEDYCSALTDNQNTFVRYIKLYAEITALSMHLLLRRPLYRCKDNPVPPDDDYDVLIAATQLMEKILWQANDGAFAPWAWYTDAWLRWHVVAVLLAELCAPRDAQLAKRSYLVAKQGFSYYSGLMSASNLEHVWIPISKLMNRANRLYVTPTLLQSTPDLTYDRSVSQTSPQTSSGFQSLPGTSTASMFDGISIEGPLQASLPQLDDDMWLNWESFVDGVGDTWTPIPEYLGMEYLAS